MSEINNNYGLNDIGMGKGIRITTGFDLGAQVPLDSRIVVKNMTDLKAMPKDKIYLGLLLSLIFMRPMAEQMAIIIELFLTKIAAIF